MQLKSQRVHAWTLKPGLKNVPQPPWERPLLGKRPPQFRARARGAGVARSTHALLNCHATPPPLLPFREGTEPRGLENPTTTRRTNACEVNDIVP